MWVSKDDFLSRVEALPCSQGLSQFVMADYEKRWGVTTGLSIRGKLLLFKHRSGDEVGPIYLHDVLTRRQVR